MNDMIPVVIWTILIMTSIGWYGFLVFYVGYKGGVEIKEMTDTLKQRNARNPEE